MTWDIEEVAERNPRIDIELIREFLRIVQKLREVGETADSSYSVLSPLDNHLNPRPPAAIPPARERYVQSLGASMNR
ncbi:MAG: hypothetical protein IT452_17975 [Planctomycetia bacterium]|nr:hypothetical protein [Planctomycetia bacterium]